MTREELFFARDLFDTILSNKGRLEDLKKDLATFKKQIGYPVMTFDMSDMTIKVYRNDVIKCMENEIADFENKINEQLEKFSKL